MQNPIICFHLWNWNPDIALIGDLTFRWNTLMLLLAFLMGRQLLLHFYEKDKPPVHVANMAVYLVVAALIGARLGHVLFYEPASLLTNPLTIVFPFELKPEFHLLRRSEFSLHGAVLAVLAFLFVYQKKQLRGQPYTQVLDRVTLASCLAGALIFLGSFLNSDMVGKETSSSVGTVFIQPVLKGLMKVPCCIMRTPDGKNPLDGVAAAADPSSSGARTSRKRIILDLSFQPAASEQLAKEFLVGDVKRYLYNMAAFVYEPGTQPLQYRVFSGPAGNHAAQIWTLAIARYPVQLFEAIACLSLFFFFFRAYKGKQMSERPGRIFGFIAVVFWTLEFGFGFMKEEQTRTSIVLNIIFALAGLALLVRSSRKKLSRTPSPETSKTRGV